MNPYAISLISLCSVSIVIGITILFFVKKMNYIDEKKDSRSNFKRCFYIPNVIGFIQYVLVIAIVALLVLDYGLNPEGKRLSIYAGIYSFSLGFIIGGVIGTFYYLKKKKPFLVSNFPDKYEEYEDEVKHMHGKYTTYYWYSDIVSLFYTPIGSFCLLIGMLVQYIVGVA